MSEAKLSRALLGAIAVMVACCSVAPAHATVFLIDEFTIIRNQAVFFQDTFSDNLPPPSTPTATFGDGSSAIYNVQGVPGPEAGGKLALDTSLGLAGFNFNESSTNLTVRARANSNISITNFTLGLKSDDTFSVSALFDLIAPTELSERYAIRLSDAAAAEGSDIIDLRVARRGNGTLAIEFRDIDDLGNTNVVLDEAPLDLSHDQIILRLSRNSLSNNNIVASFAYVDGGIAGAFTTFGHTTTIFDGENFTRAEFRAVVRVPEPSMLMLLGAGLIGWGAAAAIRRR